MKYHVLNIVRGGLPVVGAVTGGLTVAKRKPGLLWLAGGSLAGWIGGYVARNVILGMFKTTEPMPKQAFTSNELKQAPADAPKIPDFVQEEKPSESVGQVIDIGSKKRPPNNDGFGSV